MILCTVAIQRKKGTQMVEREAIPKAAMRYQQERQSRKAMPQRLNFFKSLSITASNHISRRSEELSLAAGNVGEVTNGE